MGNCVKYVNDGSRVIDFNTGWQSNAVFTGSFFVQRWFQRFLQRLFTNFILSYERDLPGFDSNGFGDRLGFRSDNNCIYLHMGIKLAANFLLHFSATNDPHILCIQIYIRIASVFGSKTSVLGG